MNTNIQVGDRVRDNGSYYIKEQIELGPSVDFGTVTEVGEGGVMVHWDGCYEPYFCSFSEVRHAYTDSDYPVNWTSHEMEYLKGLDLGKMDNVNNPAHYGNGSIECIDYIEDFLNHDEFQGYLRGNIAKYMHRFPYKNGVEDLKKAQWYLNKLIETVENT